MQELFTVVGVVFVAIVLACSLPFGNNLIASMERANLEQVWETEKQLILIEADNVRREYQ
jgi:hypothetical protein